jgi:hypothetical protein
MSFTGIGGKPVDIDTHVIPPSVVFKNPVYAVRGIVRVRVIKVMASCAQVKFLVVVRG